MSMSYKQVVSTGHLTWESTVYAPWLGSVREILKDAGLDWTKQLLVRDIDVDFSKNNVRLSLAALAQQPGEDILTIEISLTKQPDEDEVSA
jgi:hypothetical protein